MKRILLLVALLLSIAASSNAQTQSSTITTNAATCTPGVCVQLKVNNNHNTVTFDITGTWTGTLSFEFSADGGTTYRALSAYNIVSQSSVTSATANGTFTTVNNNYTDIRIRGSASITGTANVIIRPSNNGASTGIIFGGGGSTIGTVNQGTASATENWRVNCVSGCAGGTSDTDDGSVAAGQTTSIPATLNHIYNGSAWTRLTFGQAAMAASLPVVIASNQSAVPISAASLPLPTGAATSAKQPALGTAGSASTDVITVQGIASGTNLNVNCAAGCSGSSVTDADDASIAVGQTGVALSLGLSQVYDGSVWRRLTVGTAGTPSAQVLSVQGVTSSTPLRVTQTDTAGDSAVDGTANAVKVLNVDSTGAAISPGISCNNVFVIDTAASGNTQLVALASSQTIYICSYALTAEATVDAKLVTGTGTACATGEASITGNYAFSTTTGMLGLARGSGLGMVTKGATSSAVCLKTSGAVQINGEITYTQF